MARIRRKIIFCTECGKQNPQRNKKCQFCNKQLHQKNHLLRDYLQENVKDKLKDEVVDNIFSLLKNYILSHLYGTVLIATVIFTTASIILNTINTTKTIKEIETRPIINASSLDFCNNSIQATLHCDNSLGFNENNMCVKVKIINAKSSKACSDGYHLNSNKCISDKTYTKSTKLVCKKPTVMPDFLSSWNNFIRVYESNGQCLLESCLSDGWDENGVCQAGSSEPIDYTEVITCSEGSLINGECKKIKSTITKYSCEEGILDGKKCNIEYEEEPIRKCDNGYEYNEDCKACVEVE